ncbi:MAG: hypothetical protein HY059_09315 [Proteobacteria bacterium]|nr:hypothetical protein [Pseudomonadota bacterium]
MKSLIATFLIALPLSWVRADEKPPDFKSVYDWLPEKEGTTDRRLGPLACSKGDAHSCTLDKNPTQDQLKELFERIPGEPVFSQGSSRKVMDAAKGLGALVCFDSMHMLLGSQYSCVLRSQGG